MRLLENLLWNIKDKKPGRISIEEDGSFEIHYNYRDDWGGSFTYDTHFGEKHEQSEWFRPLTIDEQVDYLYEKCCQDASNLKDLREIALWMNKWYYPEDGFLLLCLKWPSRESDIKQLLRQALNQQEK